MRYSCLNLLLTVALVVTLGTGQADTGKRAPSLPAVKPPAPSQPAPPAQPQPQQQQNEIKEPWPRTFVPSEKITADSVVSFPVDI